MKNKGFTLIELLVVVAIIGILAAVGVVAYSGYTSGAKKKVTEANHKVIAKYIQNELAKCMIGESKIFDYNGAKQFDCNGTHNSRGNIPGYIEKIFKCLFRYSHIFNWPICFNRRWGCRFSWNCCWKGKKPK